MPRGRPTADRRTVQYTSPLTVTGSSTYWTDTTAAYSCSTPISGTFATFWTNNVVSGSHEKCASTGRMDGCMSLKAPATSWSSTSSNTLTSHHSVQFKAIRVNPSLYPSLTLFSCVLLSMTTRLLSVQFLLGKCFLKLWVLCIGLGPSSLMLFSYFFPRLLWLLSPT